MTTESSETSGPSATGAAPRVLSDPVPRPPSWARARWNRAIAYLRSHPALVLLLLSPGIPEYLSGSSRLNALVVNPPWFFLQLGLNLGLYVPGVLLIREAAVRWQKGWGSVLLLGAAYGILEEGVALSTMFNPEASVVGGLGQYGHYLGVNTVWVPGVLMVHMVYSIGLPILLLSLAIPETNGRSLVTPRQVRFLLAVLATDVTVLFLAVYQGAHFFMGWPLLLGSFVAIGGLVAAAYRWRTWSERPLPPLASPGAAALLGSALFPGVILSQAICESANAPAALAVLVTVAVLLAVGLLGYRYLRGSANERVLLAFSAGVLAPILLFGAVANAPIDLALVADVLVGLWFAALFAKYPGPTSAQRSRGVALPPGVGQTE